MNSSNLLLTTQMFYPDISATSKIMTHLAVDLSKSGLKVNVVSQNRDYNNPDKVFESSENVDGVNVERYEVPLLNKNSMISRLLLSNIVAKRTIDAIKNYDSEVYISVSNPPNLPLKVAEMAKKENKYFIYILHDLYPDILFKTKKLPNNPVLMKLLKRKTSKIFKISDKIIVLGRDVKNYIISNYSIESTKIEIIPNWGIKSINNHKNIFNFREKFSLKDKFIVMYTGNIGETADFDVLLNAAKELRFTNDEIFFVIIGNGRKKKEISEKVLRNSLNNVLLIDFQSEDKYRSILNSADAFFVSLKRELYGISVPSKTYYYLSEGKPILGVLPKNSEIDLEISEDKFGYSCTDYNSKTLIEMILKLKNDKVIYSQMCKNALETFNKHYEREVVTNKYSYLIKNLIKKVIK